MNYFSEWVYDPSRDCYKRVGTDFTLLYMVQENEYLVVPTEVDFWTQVHGQDTAPAEITSTYDEAPKEAPKGTRAADDYGSIARRLKELQAEKKKMVEGSTDDDDDDDYDDSPGFIY